MQIKRQTKSSDTPKIYCYDRENYTKPMICNICKCKFNNKHGVYILKQKIIN